MCGTIDVDVLRGRLMDAQKKGVSNQREFFRRVCVAQSMLMCCVDASII